MKKKIANLGILLSRDQAKKITGGVGDNGSWVCTFYWYDGTSCQYLITGPTGQGAQCAADQICGPDPNCENADCAGSGAC
jgi:hypothetical protein